jgi:prepilin-type N-terminal cleavage/methylation domain-containing protein
MRRGGFSLIEMLIVIMMMVIVVGVTASLLGGFAALFEATTDQSVARRRAQMVFNILKTPIQNAGIGLPDFDMGYYFTAGTPPDTMPPVLSWDSVVGSISRSTKRGNALRVLYSIPSGVKNLHADGAASGTLVDTFSGNDSDPSFPLPGNASKTATLVLSKGISQDTLNPNGIRAGAREVGAFITFPGIDMRPLFVSALQDSGTKAVVHGKIPRSLDEGVFYPNTILPYHDLYLVRAGVAYVDDNSNFVFLDVTNSSTLDPATSGTFPNASAITFSGFRVEGIRAVSFDVDPDGRYVQVWVLAEGDIADATRSQSAAAINAIRQRWGSIVSTDSSRVLHYEDFFMTWRIRNLQK